MTINIGVRANIHWGGGVKPSCARMADANCLKPTRFGRGGGGVVAEIVRDLQKPTRFGGGG